MFPRYCFGDSLKNIFRYHGVGHASKGLMINLISAKCFIGGLGPGGLDSCYPLTKGIGFLRGTQTINPEHQFVTS